MRITNSQLASVLSLAIFASADTIPSISAITHVSLRQHDGKLRVMATDRYCAVRADYELSREDLATGQPVYLAAKTAKSFLPMIKKLSKNGVAEIAGDRIDLEDGTTIPLVADGFSYPAVDRLFDNEYGESAPEQLSIRPAFIARLAQVIMPENGKPDKDLPWIFRFRNAGNGKPGPVLCTPGGNRGDDMAVLIQPNLITA